MWTRKELKTNAKASLKINYWTAVGVWVVFGLISIGASFVGSMIPFVGSLAASIFLVQPLTVGIYNYTLKNRNGEGTMGDLFSIFNKSYMNAVAVTLLKSIFIFLWSLLFLIPGIIKSYQWRLVEYIIAENPDMNWQDALQRSKELMDGNKWKAFVLDLSFLGWYILSVLTFGILSIFWVTPYQGQTNAELYIALKENTPVVESTENKAEDTF